MMRYILTLKHWQLFVPTVGFGLAVAILDDPIPLTRLKIVSILITAVFYFAWLSAIALFFLRKLGMRPHYLIGLIGIMFGFFFVGNIFLLVTSPSVRNFRVNLYFFYSRRC